MSEVLGLLAHLGKELGEVLRERDCRGVPEVGGCPARFRASRPPLWASNGLRNAHIFRVELLSRERSRLDEEVEPLVEDLEQRPQGPWPKQREMALGR